MEWNRIEQRFTFSNAVMSLIAENGQRRSEVWAHEERVQYGNGTHSAHGGHQNNISDEVRNTIVWLHIEMSEYVEEFHFYIPNSDQ